MHQMEANWVGNFCATSTDKKNKKISPRKLNRKSESASSLLMTVSVPDEDAVQKRPKSPYLEVSEPPPIIWGGLRREDLANPSLNRSKVCMFLYFSHCIGTGVMITMYVMCIEPQSWSVSIQVGLPLDRHLPACRRQQSHC